MDGKAPAGVVAALGLCINEIERLTAALRAQPGPVSVDDVEWAGKVHLAEAIDRLPRVSHGTARKARKAG